MYRLIHSWLDREIYKYGAIDRNIYIYIDRYMYSLPDPGQELDVFEPLQGDDLIVGHVQNFCKKTTIYMQKFVFIILFGPLSSLGKLSIMFGSCCTYIYNLTRKVFL